MNDYIGSRDCLYVECIIDRTVRNKSFKVQVFRNVTLCRWVIIIDITKLHLRGAVGTAQSV